MPKPTRPDDKRLARKSDGDKYRHRMITLPPALDDHLIKWSIESGQEISPMLAKLIDEFLRQQSR